jgi:2-desacetyl-2-hydroxyethyl bacteriochlorophyllide A dehydrogenase
MESYHLLFTAPYKIAIQREELPEPGPGQVRVETLLSAVSPGTELLIYRGQFPQDIPVDESLTALSGSFVYPLRYGYAAVGRVEAAGEGVDPAWVGSRVFAFQPHASRFLAVPGELILVPAGLPTEEAVLLPNMETAVNFVMDGAPLIGERVAVFGQGIVGLLTTALLARFPLAALVTLDRYPLRREASLDLGVQASLDPAVGGPDILKQFSQLFPGGADLVYELSGAPEALDSALAAAGFAGRVVIGSWYGQKRASLDLGGRFHRSRLRLICSQVSTLSPELTGRWTKERRFTLAWEMLRLVQPSRWITHRLPMAQAPEAYRLLDQQPDQAIQVVFTYPS